MTRPATPTPIPTAASSTAPRPARSPRLLLLLLDIGNTHCHVAAATPNRLLRQADLRTRDVVSGRSAPGWSRVLHGERPTAAVVCSVVPRATRRAVSLLRQTYGLDPLVLTDRTLRGVGLDYPRPETIGPDRLANAIATRHYFGAPSVVVDFGTAVTFDIVDPRGMYVGGIIAPGLAAMTEYLHEKTALLPKIRIREVRSAIGRSTEEAMLVGAVHGYRGLVRQLIAELKKELGADRLPVAATGGYARLMAEGVPEITAVRPNLTLDGLRLLWREHRGG
jgi:type III pantothenate kinase